MGVVFAIAWKDIRHLLRDRAAAFFTLAFPLLLAVFFGLIFPGGGGGSGKMKVAIVNEDGGPASVDFASALKSDDALRVLDSYAAEGGESRPLDRERGMNLVRKGSVSACIILKKGFQEASENMFMGRPVEIEAIVEPGRAAEAGLLNGKLQEKAFTRMMSRFTDRAQLASMLDRARSQMDTSGFDPERKQVFNSFFSTLEQFRDEVEAAATEDAAAGTSSADAVSGFRPVQVTVSELGEREKGPRSKFEISFPQGVVWGLMGCVLAFGASIAGERSKGTLVRLTTAPIARSTILAGKAVGCFVSCLFVQVMLVSLGVLLGVRVESWPNLAIAMLSSAVGFSGLMMLFAGLCRTEASVRGLGQAVVLILTMIGGGTIPLFLLPEWAQTASSISPFRWALLGIEGATWRDFSLAQMALPVGVMAGLALVGFVVGGKTMRLTDA